MSNNRKALIETAKVLNEQLARLTSTEEYSDSDYDVIEATTTLFSRLLDIDYESTDDLQNIVENLSEDDMAYGLIPSRLVDKLIDLPI